MVTVQRVTAILLIMLFGFRLADDLDELPTWVNAVSAVLLLGLIAATIHLELRRRKAFTKPSVERRTEVLKAVYKEDMYGNKND